jgi:23S rRNA (cytosine1962-C5)-methyltransferase
MKSIRLRDNKERSLLRRHPWVFEGSIDKGGADSGETVRVQAHDGRFLAWGAYSPRSSIRVRAWSFDEAEHIDDTFFERRLAVALALRARLALASDGVRLVHGDGMRGHAPNAPYHSVIAAAVADEPAAAWLEQLAVGGRLIAPVRKGERQMLAVVDREPSGYKRVELEEVHFVPLKSGVN